MVVKSASAKTCSQNNKNAIEIQTAETERASLLLFMISLQFAFISVDGLICIPHVFQNTGCN